MRLTHLPGILVGVRFALAGLLLGDALDRHVGIWFITGYVIAFLSDIFDGVIARRLHVSTVQLRQADSWADVSLYVCIAVSVWLTNPGVLIDFRVPLLVAIAAQLLLFAISLVKFGKSPSFHTWLAKAWGITLFIATISLFGFHQATPLWLAIVFCLINSGEEILMTLLLPEWQHDVLSLFHALQRRDDLLKSRVHHHLRPDSH